MTISPLHDRICQTVSIREEALNNQADRMTQPTTDDVSQGGVSTQVSARMTLKWNSHGGRDGRCAWKRPCSSRLTQLLLLHNSQPASKGPTWSPFPQGDQTATQWQATALDFFHPGRSRFNLTETDTYSRNEFIFSVHRASQCLLVFKFLLCVHPPTQDPA